MASGIKISVYTARYHNPTDTILQEMEASDCATFSALDKHTEPSNCNEQTLLLILVIFDTA
jgi:hypothetical protein